jgi:hypothetical protein
MEESRDGVGQIVGPAEFYNTGDVGAVEVRIDREGVRVSMMHDASCRMMD